MLTATVLLSLSGINLFGVFAPARAGALLLVLAAAYLGGKTGTAEMFENGESFDNGLFIAFAPFDNPQIVICVVGEGAGHGAYVAPIVRDMLDEYFSVGKSDRAASRQAENTLIR